MPEIVLSGCTPEPLMSYLKALAILRLVAEQADPEARGAWRGGAFVLQSELDRSSLERFFLSSFRPTPIAAPWAGGSGFFGNDNRDAVNAIAASSTDRLEDYRVVIARIRSILLDEGQDQKPADSQKEHLLRRYRRELPDAFIEWMDCALVLKREGQAFPPILGTGGNDGRLDFTQNYMQRLVDLGIDQPERTEESRTFLAQALTAEPAPGLRNVSIGQFDPGRAGGANAGQGLGGGSFVNPWEFVMMIEGALLLAGSLARRMGMGSRDGASFPFTVKTSSVGYGSAGEQDEGSGRGEIWLPLWTRFAGLNELKRIFAEGRAEVSGRQSRDGVDFALAVGSLGVDRGVQSFVRYGFLKRSGKAFVAVPEGRFDVQERKGVGLLGEYEGWIGRFRRATKADATPPRFASAARRIDSAVFDFCRFGGTDRMAAILRALGNAERQLASGEAFRKNDKRTIQPVPVLSEKWLDACNDQSPEFRLAQSLAFIRGSSGVDDLRTNLEPVEARGSRWQWDETPQAVVWSGADLERNLVAVLARRLTDANRSGSDRLPLQSRYPATLDDVSAFLAGETDDERLEELLWGLLLVGNQGSAESEKGPRGRREESVPPLPRSYALLKLLFLPGPLQWPAGAAGVSLRPEPEILARLRAGDPDSAALIAHRRLRASGLVPMPGPKSGGPPRTLDPGPALPAATRLAAALLFPVSQVDSLAKLTLRPRAETSAEPIPKV